MLDFQINFYIKLPSSGMIIPFPIPGEVGNCCSKNIKFRLCKIGNF